LTFCSNLSNPKKLSIETISEFKNLSISKKINFLRLVGRKEDGSNQFSFELTWLDHSLFPIHSKPKFTAIIVEIDRNNKINKSKVDDYVLDKGF
jgi:hypothetical protein